jgi:hypothetical protein
MFVLNAKGEHLLASSSSLRHIEDMESEIWSETLHALDDAKFKDIPFCELGAYMVPDPEGIRTHTVLFVPNIAEYQAAEIADKVGLRFWISPKAYHEGTKRIPIHSTINFFDISNGPDPWNSITAGPVSQYIRMRAAHPGAFKREPGLFMLCHFARILAAKSPGACFEEKLEAAIHEFKKAEAKGHPISNLYTKFDVAAPDELLTTFTLFTPEEAAACSMPSPV